MSEKKYTWHKIADQAGELPFEANQMCVVTLNGKKITIARQKNQLFAFAFKCPHAGGIMSQGYIDPVGNVVCPLHRYKFNITNGRNTSGEGFYLKTWPVQVGDDGIFVGMEESGGIWSVFR
jgi:nitrite reductase/ring-hydroxylating ferredoxin subunit